jgi:hypothetical protein
MLIIWETESFYKLYFVTEQLNMYSRLFESAV